MFAKASLVALVGAVAVSALDSRAVHTILQRQLSPSSVPDACQSTCQSTFTIYNACLNGDTNTCLGVCQSGTFSEVTSCFQCVLDQTPGVSQSEVDEVNQALGQLETVCSQAGQTVSAASLTAASGAASASSGDASASGAIASITDATFTSASGGLTVGGASASATSRASTTSSGGVAASASSAVGGAVGGAASSASSAAASAAPSGAASVGAKLPSFAAMALGLAGVGAGAVFVL